jgi:hypothetical protein
LIKKFSSLSGISLEAANPGGKVKVALTINCKDNIVNDESKFDLARRVLDDIVYPEVIQRSQDNNLPPDFHLRQAHILMFDNEYKNKVLLNDEVGFFANVILKEGKLNNSHTVHLDDIKEVLDIHPIESIAPNAAHIMLLKIGPKWHTAWSLVYNKKSARIKAETAKDFLITAQYNLSKEIWGPFVDVLFTATELAIRSILSLIHLWEFSTEQNYDTMANRLKQFVENGNVPKMFLEHYIETKRLSDKIKDTYGIVNDKFGLDSIKGNILFKQTEEIINFVYDGITLQKLNKGTIINFSKLTLE